ncbi:MAG TPA: peptidoglycan bridge formation glycyltransferase FemA/FemB family protein, partial [Candidatus Woesebacteria bacterium]|nr:peptidoglycan bridge formation glycyltransferase FemA/FemB family protein [Candidatus Woesebacteria bacterium]
QNFHQTQWQILQRAGISHLLTAGRKDDILAAFLLFVFKDTLYYPYGASTREHKELMAPTLLMWEAIKFGKKLGLKKFDLWGDLEPNPSPNHPYYGFHRFKEGFSPKLVEFVGTYDLVINPKLYKLYNLIDKLRWKILRLKAKTS